MNRKFMKKVFILSLLLFVCRFSYAQALDDSAIDNLVDRTMKAFEVPGISVGVIKDGKVIHSKGYGVRSLNTMQKMDENTLVAIGSNTKAFTTAALGILVDEGKIKWDDKVRDYIPEFKLYNPYVSDEFTIRDLLTHRSGLGLGAGDLMIFPDGTDFTKKDVIYNLRFLKQTSSFRSKFDYDNNLYIVAGEVIERVTGKSWADFIEERIMRPLGMKNSAATYTRLKDLGDVTDPHNAVNGKVQVIPRNLLKIGEAAGGIYSNIPDMCKWVQTLLNKGKYGEGLSQTLISENVHRELWSPQTILPVGAPGPYNTHFSAYALGFGVSDVNGYKQVSHSGGIDGMVTYVLMIPELNFGVIVLTNQMEGLAFVAIANQIKDGYLGKTGTDWVADLSAARKKSLEQAKTVTDTIWRDIDQTQKSGKNNVDLNLFTGKYTDQWLGDVTISIKSGKLWFEAKRSPKLTGELLPYKGNTFVAKWDYVSMPADAFVNFKLDEEGKASGFTMKPVSPLTDFSFDFQDLDFHRAK
jgi:CubicO group peptidase (beta-lactamase class C family)